MAVLPPASLRSPSYPQGAAGKNKGKRKVKGKNRRFSLCKSMACRWGARRNYDEARRNYDEARRNYDEARRNYDEARRNYDEAQRVRM